jgi:hypothetical protein
MSWFKEYFTLLSHSFSIVMLNNEKKMERYKKIKASMSCYAIQRVSMVLFM